MNRMHIHWILIQLSCCSSVGPSSCGCMLKSGDGIKVRWCGVRGDMPISWTFKPSYQAHYLSYVSPPYFRVRPTRKIYRTKKVRNGILQHWFCNVYKSRTSSDFVLRPLPPPIYIYLGLLNFWISSVVGPIKICQQIVLSWGRK